MIAKGERGSGGDKLEGVWDEQIPTTTHKAVSNPRGSPNPRGCPPIRTIFQSSPDALVNNRLLGNLKRERETSTPDAECSPRQLSLECSLSLGHLCWTGTQGPPGPSKPSVYTLRTFHPPGVGVGQVGKAGIGLWEQLPPLLRLVRVPLLSSRLADGVGERRALDSAG